MEQNVIYYLDSVSGNNANTGHTPQAPFRSFAALPCGDLAPGTRIYVKCGSYFEGGVSLTGTGTETSPILLTSYGEGANPVIDGLGGFSALEIRNSSYMEVSDLELVNVGVGEGARRGLTITSGGEDHPGGVLAHLVFQRLIIHDISSTLGRNAAGIYIENTLSQSPCYYHDLLVEDCHVYTTGSCGIILNSLYGKRPEVGSWDIQPFPFTPATGVVIRRNVVHDMPGDGMWISTTKGALLEYNTVYNTSYGQNTAYAGMWPHNSDDAVMQYNEVYHNRLAAGDGQGLDIDINCNNTIVQYNYSHDNEGGFILVCTDGEKDNYNRGSIIRYNISQNDGHNLICLQGIEITGLQIYNNTFYTEKGYDNGTISTLLWSKNDCTFTNNIFVDLSGKTSGRFVDNKDGQAKSRDNDGLHMVFDTNVFYGNSSSAAPVEEYDIQVLPTNKTGVDPQLVNPGKGTIGRHTADGYRLERESPFAYSGKRLMNTGNMDFYGSKDETIPSSVGAYNAVFA